MRQTSRIRACAAALLMLAAPAIAQDDGALVEFQTMKPDFAVRLAQAALEACRGDGYQVAVVVVDRFGQPQVAIRDRYAGAHTVDTAEAKAWSAASFRERTLELERMIAEGELSQTLRDIPGALMLGGGVPVRAAGSIVGAIGISGAPGPDLDDECAQAALDELAMELEF